jgi:sporulation protein YunB
MDFNLKPVILSMAEAKARVMGVEAINNAAYEIMREFSPLTYDALITIIQDNDGRVAMLQADTMRMNEIGTRTALLAQRNLDALAATGMRIPLGAATGSKLLAGRGPAITVNLVPMGSVSTEFVSEFTQAGINQTRHRIYLKIKASVRMVIPTASNVSEVSAYVQIAESIIVGQVPNTFADIQPDNVLDLLPGS